MRRFVVLRLRWAQPSPTHQPNARRRFPVKPKMMMWVAAVAILLALFCSTAVVMAEQPVVLKPVVVFVEGDSSVISKFINMCREMGPERGMDFRVVDKLADKYDYRVVL